MESQNKTPSTGAGASVAPVTPVVGPLVTAGASPAASEVQGAEKSNRAAAIGMFKEGMGLLRGIGTHQDFSMAAARLLDSADLNHPPALFYCALLYFAGVGVSRNTQTASDYAGRYLEASPDGQFSQAAKEVMDGTLGTENAKKLLVERPAAPKAAQAAGPKSKKKLYIAAAVMVTVMLVGGLAVFSKTRDVSSLGPSDISGIKLESLLSKDDIAHAKQEALATAASLQSDAQSLMQKQDADKAAQAKALQEQKDSMDAQAKAAQEQKDAQAKAEQGAQASQAKADQDRAATSQNTSQVKRQTAAMIATAMQAARAGEFDRANGILDGVLAGESSNQEALGLKDAIKSARSRAVNNLQVK